VDHSRFHITSKQLIFIIIGTQISAGVLSLPRLVAGEAAQHAWISVLVGAVPSFLAIALICYLYSRFNDPDFVNVSKRLFGRYLGSTLMLVFITYAVYFESIAVRVFAEITSVYMLPTTPKWAIVLILIIAAVYAISLGGQVIGRINEILFYLILFDLVIISIPVLTDGEILNLYPLTEIDYLGVLKGAIPTSFAYSGVEVLIVFYALTGRRDEVFKAAIIGQTIVVVVYLLAVLAALSVFGIDSIATIFWPILTLLKVPDLTVIERLEFFFLVLLGGLGVRPTLNLGLAASYSFLRVFDLDFKKYYVPVVIILGVIMFIIAMQPENILEAYSRAYYGGYAFWAIALGYPPLIN
jgi:spore germination protein